MTTDIRNELHFWDAGKSWPAIIGYTYKNGGKGSGIGVELVA